MTKKTNDESSRRDLHDWRQFDFGDIPGTPPSKLYCIFVLSDFEWDDESWEPMTTELVSLVSSEVLAKRLVSLGVCRSSPRTIRAGRTSYDYCEIPLTSQEKSWRDLTWVYVVFWTHYQSIYRDVPVRVHDAYKNDGSGSPAHAFTCAGQAEEEAKLLTRKFLEDCPPE